MGHKGHLTPEDRLMAALLVGASAAFVVGCMVLEFRTRPPDREPRQEFEQPEVRTDPETGCQYIRWSNEDDFTLRYNREGRPLCPNAASGYVKWTGTE